MAELVAYFDRDQNYVGYGDHQTGQDRGHYTKNVFAFLVHVDPTTGEGGLLLSVRSPLKDHYGGLIEESAGGTVRLLDPETGLTETAHEAAEREIAEEIGVRLLGRLALITTHTHEFAGRGLGGLRRHHTALMLGATDTAPHEAVLHPEEIDRLLVVRTEAELAALDRVLCIPSIDEELQQLIDYLRPHAGEEDAVLWAVNNWQVIVGQPGDV
jgi:ADP-ribose pyrophosphatase YjhB (NUDIX family)